MCTNGGGDRSVDSTVTQIQDRKMFRSQIVIIQPKQDILAELASLSGSQGQKLLILSAIGLVSRVTLQTKSGTKTYKGYMEIVTIGGFICPPSMGEAYVTITFNGPDGSHCGGRATSPLVAATPIQITLGMVPPTMNLELPTSSAQRRPAEQQDEASEQDSNSVSVGVECSKEESFDSSSPKDI